LIGDKRKTAQTIRKKDSDNPKQLTANVGLFFIAYQLSKKGWNVMPTTRNAKGPDLIIYSQDGKTMRKIQVKSLSRWNHIMPGPKENFLMSDFVVICTGVYGDNPETYIAKTRELYKSTNKHGWINKKEYVRFKDNWKIIK